jgi:hypothetical protein
MVSFERLSLYPFAMLRKQIGLLVITAIPIIFILTAATYASGDYSMQNVLGTSDRYFGGNIHLSATDLAKYDQIGGDGLIPIIRFGGVTKVVQGTPLDQVSQDIAKFFVVYLAVFIAYMAYAVISRSVFDSKQARASWGLRGITPSTVGLSLLGAFVVMFFSMFAMQGFQLVLLLNFGVFFALSIPIAATGESMGESLYKGFDFLRFNLSGVVQMYLLSMGAAIAAPIGLLIVFMFPLSVLDPSMAVVPQLIISLFGIAFALFYQFVVCARSVYEFTHKTKYKVPAFRKIGRKIR